MQAALAPMCKREQLLLTQPDQRGFQQRGEGQIIIGFDKEKIKEVLGI
jgi:hypothetical protein